MPIYEYKCSKCDKIFEKFQKMNDSSVKKCPYCGGKPNRLISSGVGLVFKGNGFYVTNCKKKERENVSQGEKNNSKESSPNFKDKSEDS